MDLHALLRRQLKRLAIDPAVAPDAAGWRELQLLGRRRMFDSSFNAPPESLARYETCIEARLAFRDFTYGLTRADGVRCFVRISGEPVFDEGGNFLGYRGVGRDVTQAALAELK